MGGPHGAGPDGDIWPPWPATRSSTRCRSVGSRRLGRGYGRFPAYPPPFRTVLGFQAGHVDPDLYDRFHRPEALSETQRGHLERWAP